MWAIDHYGVCPDVLVSGKGLSGGVYPLSVTLFRDHLTIPFQSDAFAHVSTFGGSEIACVVTQRVLEITTDPPFLRHVDALAKVWVDSGVT